jgi:hypothetical protein
VSIDVELESWRRQWLGVAQGVADAHAAERLRQRVVRETRWLKIGLIFPILVTVVIGGAVVARALRTGQVVDVVLAAEGWIFIAVVWVGCLWIARGTWRPLAGTTAAFVDLSIRRREANLRGATFGACLYVVQLVSIVLVIVFATPVEVVDVLRSPRVIVVGWVGIPSVLTALYFFRRRERANLERLRELERELRGE